MTDPTTIPPGLIVVTTYGTIQAETADSLAALRARAVELGLGAAIQWLTVSGVLVDKTRNEAATQMLANPALQWLWFIDGDMVFDPSIMNLMFEAAFKNTPWASIVGGYCNLRGKPYLPTMDRGSGTWESHDAGQGIVEVMRTGAACMLIKRPVLEQMKAPWFEVRMPGRPLDHLYEVDNFARQRFNGKNPFTEYPEWKQLLQCAVDSADTSKAFVGEDSCFCDKVTALGFRIVVQTNAVCGHIDRQVIWPHDHTAAVAESRRNQRLLVGVTA